MGTSLGSYPIVNNISNNILKYISQYNFKHVGDLLGFPMCYLRGGGIHCFLQLQPVREMGFLLPPC